MPEPINDRVLILAPIGRDASASSALLQSTGLTVHVCKDIADLTVELYQGAAVALISEEALFGKEIGGIVDWVNRQRAWSDMPFIVLTSRQDHPRVAAWRKSIVESLRNVSLLERPVQPITLSSTVWTSVRARKRQYEIRALLEMRERVAQELQLQVEAATSDLRRQMADRAQMEQSLRQAQKMEAIGHLTGGIAHDFNNLLAAILGSLELLAKRLRDDERGMVLLKNAISGAERGATLTQRMLAFARRQDLKIKSVNIVELIDGMMDMIRRSIGPSIVLRADLDPTLPSVGADANQLESALLNLVLNARDAMSAGGVIVISAREETVEVDSEVGLKKGRYVCIAITDTGQGMDEKTIAQATQPFFTTKGIGKGTGLGLSMVQGLAEQFGGKLRIASEINRGTTMEIVLPVASEDTVSAPDADLAPRGEPIRASRQVILVVDDDMLVLNATSALLDDFGYTIITATNGNQALVQIENNTQIELIVTDYAMPDMTGLQLAEKARLLRPELPIVVASGYAELQEKIPSDIYRLTKPFYRSDLESMVGLALSVNQ